MIKGLSIECLAALTSVKKITAGTDISFDKICINFVTFVLL
jgi:hypothetical protein